MDNIKRTTTVKLHHFTIPNPENIVDLARQAWLYENREKWALDLIDSLGVKDTAIQLDIIKGKSNLKGTPDGTHCTLVVKDEPEWIGEIEEHLTWKAENTYVFAGRRVSREIVDNYTDNVVGRLRNVMRNGFTNMDTYQILDLENLREELHTLICIEAGFKREESEIRNNTENRELNEFTTALQKFANMKTKWFTEP